MSIATVVTQGFGSFGDIAHVVRDGYDGSTVAPPAVPTVTLPLGGKGDNRRRIIKPTGLVERKARKTVDERVEESAQIQAEVAGELAKQLREEIDVLESRPVERMTFQEIDREIGVLLRKKIRTEEDEILLLLLIAAAG